MFKWNKEYVTGVSVIDEQHKQLFSILDKLHITSSTEEVYDLFEALLEYTVYHFNAEEEYLLQFDQKHAQDHKKKHDEFIQMINEKDLNLLDDNSQVFQDDLFTMVSHWIKSHVIEEVEEIKNQH